MAALTRVAAPLALAVALAGCRDRRLVQLERVRAEVCRCKDAACVDAALARMPTGGPRDKRAGQKVAAEILGCVAKVGELEPAPEVEEPRADAEPKAEAEAEVAPAPSAGANAAVTDGNRSKTPSPAR